MSLTHKIFRGSVLNLIDHILRVVAMLLVTPFMVTKLGLESYGIWLVLTAAISFLGLLDGGITLSGTRYLARALGGTGNVEEVIGTLRWLYRWLGIACLIATALLVIATPWLINDFNWQKTGRLVMLALGVSASIRFFLRTHLVVLKASLRYDLIVVASLLKVVLQSALVLVLLNMGYGLEMLALAQILSDVTDQVLVVLFSVRTNPQKSRLNIYSRTLLPDILSYSGMAFLQMIGQHLRSRMDPFIISAYVGVSSVPVYNMALRLVTMFDDIVNAALGGTLLAGFSQVEGQLGCEGLRVKFLYSLRFSIALALVGGTGIFVLGPSFLVAWLGEGFSQSGDLLRILILPATVKLMQYPGFSLLYSTNRHKLLTKMTFLAGIFNALLSIVLTSWLGLSGVVLATFIEMSIFFIIIMPALISSTINVSLVQYAMELIKPFLKLIFPLALWALIAQMYVKADFILIILIAASLLLVGGLASGLLLFTPKERNGFYQLLRRISPVNKLS